MAGDDPADAVHELFAEALFREHPLARPILGTEESVASLSRNQVAGWFRRRYTPPRIVVTAVGNVDHGRVVAQVRKHLANLLERHDDADPEPPRQVSRHRVPAATQTARPADRAAPDRTGPRPGGHARTAARALRTDAAVGRQRGAGRRPVLPAVRRHPRGPGARLLGVQLHQQLRRRRLGRRVRGLPARARRGGGRPRAWATSTTSPGKASARQNSTWRRARSAGRSCWEPKIPVRG